MTQGKKTCIENMRNRNSGLDRMFIQKSILTSHLLPFVCGTPPGSRFATVPPRIWSMNDSALVKDMGMAQVRSHHS